MPAGIDTTALVGAKVQRNSGRCEEGREKKRKRKGYRKMGGSTTTSWSWLTVDETSEDLVVVVV